MRENDDLDLLLDLAIKTYAESETSPSLEQRVLARIAAGPSSAPRPRWLPWAIALPLAACLLLFVLFMSQQHRVPNQIVLAPSAPPSPVATLPAAPHPARVRSAKTQSSLHSSRPPLRAGRSAPMPKQDIFPTPQPLTSEEQTLVVFVARAPEDERKAVAEALQQIETPISVAAIHIPLLELPEKGRP